ncbi:MAG: AAA family ATPase [Verrucomicrobia bacterium]|nr:AAA family ATPase [Verrucomicrobiota bacterium]MCH8510490.1 AAA family ATPase [Kiritimatiellia bacterium]
MTEAVQLTGAQVILNDAEARYAVRAARKSHGLPPDPSTVESVKDEFTEDEIRKMQHAMDGCTRENAIERLREKQAKKPKLHFCHALDLIADRTPVDWLVKNYLPRRGLAYIYGPSGGGKTFAAVDMSAAIAKGCNWRDCRVKQSPVAILAGEGNAGLKQRLAAWVQTFGPVEQFPIFVSNTGGMIDTFEGLGEVEAALDQITRPGLVIVDTQSRWQSGDESSTRDAAAFVRNLDAIRDKYNCLVVVVHHTTKADFSTLRGSGAYLGAADAVFLATPSEIGGVKRITLSCQKMKEAVEPPPLQWEFDSVILEGWQTEDGEEVTSAILRPCDLTKDTQGRPAKDIPPEIAVEVVREYPGASQNELADLLAERATDFLKRKVGKDTARRLLVKLATIEPARLIRIEDGKRITYRLTALEASQKAKPGELI